MNRRIGVTLTEVLIAIFIMAIGLMAILALFPLGAAQMAQALKDQRAAETAANAGAILRMLWKDACELTPGASTDFHENSAPPLYKPASFQRFIYAMDDPNLNNIYQVSPGNRPYVLPPGGPPNATSLTPPYPAYPNMQPLPLPTLQSEKTQSSYPVFLDPIGWEANGTSSTNARRKWWVAHPANAAPMAQPTAAGNRIGAIPRRPLYVRYSANASLPFDQWPWIELRNLPGTSAQRVLSRFSLQDDLSYNVDGTPDLDGNPATPDTARVFTAPVQRQGRYTWAAMVRRNNNNKKDRNYVDMWVVVYSGRSIDVASGEEQYLATTPDSRRAIISLTTAPNVGKVKPALRRGSWVLDATLFNRDGTPQPQGFFYRVVNVDDETAGQVTLEFQNDLAFFVQALSPSEPRILVVLDNVVEVFYLGTISQYSPPGLNRPDETQLQLYQNLPYLP